MKYRPSAVESFIATLPEELQMESLKACMEERHRILNGPWTEEELKVNKMVKDLAVSSRRMIEKIAAQAMETGT